MTTHISAKLAPRESLSHHSIGVFYFIFYSRPFHQLALPCVILLTDGPYHSIRWTIRGVSGDLLGVLERGIITTALKFLMLLDSGSDIVV